MNSVYPRTFVLAGGIFAAAAATPHLADMLGLSAFRASHRWVDQLLIKTSLIVFALLAMKLYGGAPAQYGLRPAEPYRRWRVILPGLGLGMLATALIFVTPAKGMKVLQSFGFLSLVLLVWLLSSISEEIFTRGWFQGSLETEATKPVSLLGFSLPRPVLASALLFGGLHLSLLVAGADLWTVGIIVSSTFFLGLCAGQYRHRYRGLGPSILVHVAFNVGGFLGGIAMVLAHKLLYGTLPTL